MLDNTDGVLYAEPIEPELYSEESDADTPTATAETTPQTNLSFTTAEVDTLLTKINDSEQFTTEEKEKLGRLNLEQLVGRKHYDWENDVYTSGEEFNDSPNNNASGAASHAEGQGAFAGGNFSHAEGFGTNAKGENSHAEGQDTTAFGNSSHAEGKSSNDASFGNNATTDEILDRWNKSRFSLAFGDFGSHVEGNDCLALGYSAHAEGNVTQASGAYSHAEGSGTRAIGTSSHAEGGGTTASGSNSHAEGGGTTASGSTSHAEGSGARAEGHYSHAEGGGTLASGSTSHAEGGGTTASGSNSHAEGQNTHANGNASHAEGLYTVASGEASHAGGKYNIADTSDKFAFIIGNGTNDSNRSNAFAIDWEGNIYVGNSETPVNVLDLLNRVAALEAK